VSDTPRLIVRELGRRPYEPVWRAMQAYTDTRGPDSADELWLVEHDPVFTLGQAGRMEHVLAPGEIPVLPVDRGGQVTYHGPGQLVAYPLLDLRRPRASACASSCTGSSRPRSTRSPAGASRPGAATAPPGVYVDGAKVMALGLRVRRGCSFHGLAFNIAMDLTPVRAYQSLWLPGFARDPGARLGRSGQRARGRPGARAAARAAVRIDPATIERAAAAAGGLSHSMEAAEKHIPILVEGDKQTGRDKIARNPVVFDAGQALLRKPPWIRVRIPSHNAVAELKQRLRAASLVTVCEEASCPNIHECFAKGTATFMVLGEVCTRRCAFCDVAHGRPKPPDSNEPVQLARTIREMRLRYVVITSVDRDDLRDGGARHFADCIRHVREQNPRNQGRDTDPGLSRQGTHGARPGRARRGPAGRVQPQPRDGARALPGGASGRDYDWSLRLLEAFKAQHPALPTKSGIMLGLGETRDEVLETLQDLRAHRVDMVTIGQYLQPSRHHHPVLRYWTPEEFKELETAGYGLGFSHVASGPMVRSSYHADEMAHAAGVVAGSD
jgi:lipoic acid synthetase